MNYQYMDYDLTEYKELEKDLNAKSKKGINPVSLGKLSHFKKTGKRYFYHVDFMIKKPGTPKRKTMHDMINDYDRQMFDYVGKIDKFMVFRTENQRSIPAKRKEEMQKFLSTRFIQAMTYMIIATFGCAYLTYMINLNTSLSDLATNGAILLRICPYLLTLVAFVRTLSKVLYAKGIKQPVLKKIFNVLVVVSAIAFFASNALDLLERKDVPVDDQVLTLEDFNRVGNLEEFPTYLQTDSMIVDYISYTQAGDEDAISSKLYKLKDEKATNKYFEQLKASYQDCKPKVLDDNIILYQMDGQYDTILYRYHNTIVYVTSSFELSDKDIQTIQEYAEKSKS